MHGHRAGRLSGRVEMSGMDIESVVIAMNVLGTMSVALATVGFMLKKEGRTRPHLQEVQEMD